VSRIPLLVVRRLVLGLPSASGRGEQWKLLLSPPGNQETLGQITLSGMCHLRKRERCSVETEQERMKLHPLSWQYLEEQETVVHWYCQVRILQVDFCHMPTLFRITGNIWRPSILKCGGSRWELRYRKSIIVLTCPRTKKIGLATCTGCGFTFWKAPFSASLCTSACQLESWLSPDLLIVFLLTSQNGGGKLVPLKCG